MNLGGNQCSEHPAGHLGRGGTMTEISKSRDVIERIEELETEQASALEDNTIDQWERDGFGEQLDALRELAVQGEDVEDWEYGATLIRDSYFEDYAREFAEDIGAISGEETWPLTCIDWEQAARELQMDYTAVEFDGVTYWVR